MPIARFPLVGSYTNRADGATDDQIFTNCFPETTKNPVTGNGAAKLLKRLGYTKGGALSGVAQAGGQNSTYGAGAILSWTGTANANPRVVAAFQNSGGADMSVWDLVSDTKIGGDIAATVECTAITETMVSTTPTLVANFFDNVGGNLEQWYFPEGGAWTQVTDGDFPTGLSLVGFPSHMDGFVFNMTSDGKIYNSDLNSVSAYTANNFIPVSEYPDKGVSVARQGSFIVGFGEKSIERFVNAGNSSGSPLQRVSGGTIHMGAARRAASEMQTVMNAHGTIYWLGTNSDAAITGVYRFKGMTPEKISSVSIDNLLMSGQLRGFVGTLTQHGMQHVVIRGSAGVWCYCVETNFWWKHLLQSGEMRACLGGASNAAPLAASYFIGSNNARANLYTGNQDDGSNFTQTVTTAEEDLGTQRRKFYNKLSVDYDKQSAASNLGVAWSDDGGTTFSTARNIDMSQTAKPFIDRLGSSRRRIWKYTNTANTPSGIRAAELEYEVGQN